MAFSQSDSENLSSARGIGLRSALIVTASAPTRRMYADYLEWRGVSVGEVTSAAAALDRLSAFTPDVVVIEDRLEDARGVDLALTLRRSRQTSDIPIALLSADVFGMTPERAKRFGCDLLVPVPCLPGALFDALEQLVNDGASHRAPDVDSWLFVRGDETVRIARRGELELTVWGPGGKRNAYRFRSDLELSTFQADCEQRLVHTGFTFEAYRDERRRGTDRRGSDRRRGPIREVPMSSRNRRPD